MILDMSNHQVFPSKYLTKIAVPVLSGAVPGILTKCKEFQAVLGFGAPKRPFGPKMGLRRPLRKSNDKHNVLGACDRGPEMEKLILGARNRKKRFLEIRRKFSSGEKL